MRTFIENSSAAVAGHHPDNRKAPANETEHFRIAGDSPPA
jgi:hypothetical protein